MHQAIKCLGTSDGAAHTIPMGIGFFLARFFKLDDRPRIAIRIEIGMQNSATGIFIASVLLNSITITAVPGMYPPIMYINAVILIALFNRSQSGQ